MTHKTFHIVQYKYITNWSVLQHQGHDFGYTDSYPLIAIGQFLVPYHSSIEVKDDQEYKQVTVKTKGGGVCQRCIKLGKDIGTKQQWQVRSGQFILSKIDARNGAMGVIPDELDNAIVTHDFPIFSVKKDVINPQFLILIITTESFMKFAQSCSSGTTNRQRINVGKFLQQRIPLPSLRIQNQLLEEYNKKLGKAQEIENDMQDIYKSIDSYMHEILALPSLSNSKEKQPGFIRIFNYSKIHRWDVWNERKLGISTKYRNCKFGDILSDSPKYGANVKGKKELSDIRYIRITDINEDGSLNDDIVSPEIAEEQYYLKYNDFLIARSGNTVGKTFLYEGYPEKAIYAGYLVRYRIDEKIALPKYVWYYTKTSLFKNWISANQRISGQPNINGQEYLSFPIVVPSISLQEEIVNYVNKEREKAKRLIEEASALRKQAKAEFEKAIFV